MHAPGFGNQRGKPDDVVRYVRRPIRANNHTRAGFLYASSPSSHIIKTMGDFVQWPKEVSRCHANSIDSAPITARLTSLLGQVAPHARSLSSPHLPDPADCGPFAFLSRTHAPLIHVMRSSSCLSGQCNALICGIRYRVFRKRQKWRIAPKRDRSQCVGDTRTIQQASRFLGCLGMSDLGVLQDF